MATSIYRKQSSIVKKNPNYNIMSFPKIAVAPNGVNKIELSKPMGIAYYEKTEEIFIADQGNARIKVFSIEGDFVHSFGEDILTQPAGVLIYKDFLFVTDWGWIKPSLFKFELSSLSLLQKRGRNGFDPQKEFNLLRQPCPNGRHIYIPDNNNNRIVVIEIMQLVPEKYLTHDSLSGPRDLAFRDDRIYVISNSDNPCMHIFSRSWEYHGSIITRSSKNRDKQLQYPCFFCFDPNGNFIISDMLAHCVLVITLSGEMLYKIGSHGNDSGQFDCPMGVAITGSGNLIVVSENDNYGLQIF